MRTLNGRIARAARWIVAAGGVLVIGGAAVALGATSSKATTTVPASSVGSATAHCEDGAVALAGGFAAPGWDPRTANGGPVARFDSMPAANQRGIKTRGSNFNENQAGELRSFAYCGEQRTRRWCGRTAFDPDQQLRFGHGQVPEGQPGDRGRFGTDRSVITLTSKRSGSGVGRSSGSTSRTSGLDQPGDAHRLRLLQGAWAQARHQVQGHRAELGLPGADQSGAPTVAGRGSGGFDGHVGVVNNELNAAGALDSKRTDQGHAWTTKALSVSNPNPATLTTYAYCRR